MKIFSFLFASVLFCNFVKCEDSFEEVLPETCQSEFEIAMKSFERVFCLAMENMQNSDEFVSIKAISEKYRINVNLNCDCNSYDLENQITIVFSEKFKESIKAFNEDESVVGQKFIDKFYTILQALVETNEFKKANELTKLSEGKELKIVATFDVH
jgi:hypothetical protein